VRRALRIGVRLVVAVVALLVVVLGGVAARVWWVGQQDDRRASDAIVVLGASQYDGRPSAVLEARLRHALQLWRADVAAHVITVGGSQPGDRFTEAGSGRRWLLAHGVPDDKVVAVRTGRDTLASVRAVAATMKSHRWSTAVIVTDPWHSLRSRTMADDSGIQAVTSPTRQGPSVDGTWTEARYVVRETGAYLYYRIFGKSGDTGFQAV
jgi:uncharacterized SAM-binding protein YcdF (DUF218 family)